MLKKTPLPAVGWTKIGCMQKRLVGRNITGRDEFFGQQSITMDRHALMRRPGADWVNRIGPWSEPAKPPQAGIRLPDAWIELLGMLASIRNREHHFPDAGCSVFRVFR